VADKDATPSIIDDALSEIGRIAFPDPAICTGWVIVSEWMGSGEDDVWTLTLTDITSPEWRLLGLMHHAIERMREESNEDRR
jgi:hypothetical protein